MKTTIIFIRHGETHWNSLGQIQGRTDISLNEIGLYQAHLFSNKYKKYKFDKMYSSPLIRAYETGVLISKLSYQNDNIEINDLVIERSFGELEGQKFSINSFSHDDSSFTEKYPSFESNKTIEKRAQRFCDYVLKNNPNQLVACFTHSHFIKAVLSISKSKHGYHSNIDNCKSLKVTVTNKEVIVNELNN